MADLGELRQEAMAWVLILEAVKEQEDIARNRLRDAMVTQGAEKVKHDWGTATLTGDGWHVIVVADTVLAWCKKNRPEMVRTSEYLDPTWLKLIKILAMADPDGRAVDPETGAVIPGITRMPATRGLTIRKNPDAMRSARGLIQQIALGELTAAPDEEP